MSNDGAKQDPTQHNPPPAGSRDDGVGPSKNLYIAGLPLSFRDDDLFDLCQIYGQVESAKVMMDGKTKRCKGYGFALFSNDIGANNAVRGLFGKEISGNFLQVRRARKNTRGPHEGREVSTSSSTKDVSGQPSPMSMIPALFPGAGGQPLVTPTMAPITQIAPLGEVPPPPPPLAGQQLPPPATIPLLQQPQVQQLVQQPQGALPPEPQAYGPPTGGIGSSPMGWAQQGQQPQQPIAQPLVVHTGPLSVMPLTPQPPIQQATPAQGGSPATAQPPVVQVQAGNGGLYYVSLASGGPQQPMQPQPQLVQLPLQQLTPGPGIALPQTFGSAAPSLSGSSRVIPSRGASSDTNTSTGLR